MAFVNYNNKEITAKIVYYGPALSGKTTCLRYIFNSSEIENKGKLITLDTDGDRTLFFDFLPLEIGKLGNYAIKIQLYTVPGQVSYDTTRKLVLQGADGVVIVADSQAVAREQNLESFNNLKKNLRLNNIDYNEVPIIFQYNKRDLKEIMPSDTLNRDLNPDNKSFFPTVATKGENVLEGLHAIIKLVIIHLKNKLSIFQKDKTVMFSREEITASAPRTIPRAEEKKRAQERPAPAAPPRGNGDVFELSSPLMEVPDTEVFQTFGDEEIFNLENPHETAGEPSNQVTPEKISPYEDLDQVDSFGLSDIKPSAKISKSDVPSAAPAVKNVDIPISIQLPEFKDEIKINLNLIISLKKKP